MLRLIAITVVVFTFTLLFTIQNGQSALYVDVNIPDNQTEDGSYTYPYNTLIEGVIFSDRGEDIIVRGGYYDPFEIDRRGREKRVIPYGYYNGSMEIVIINASDNLPSILFNETENVFIAGLILNGSTTPSYVNGIQIINSTNVTIYDLSVFGHLRNGVNIKHSEDIDIEACNIINNSGSGIVIINDNGTSLNNTISSCTISNNGIEGIKLIKINHSNISNNTISYNGECAIKMEGSSTNSIVYNEIINHDTYAIYILEGSSDNHIHHNHINNNNRNRTQGFDNNQQNLWDDGAEGNWWSDYDGIDLDDDGIGDIPYMLDGLGNASDRFPFGGREESLKIEIALDPNQPLAGQEIQVFVNIQVNFNSSGVIFTFWFKVDNVTSTENRQYIELTEGDNWYYFSYRVKDGSQVIGVTLHDPFDISDSLMIHPIKKQSSGTGLVSINITALILIALLLVILDSSRNHILVS